jgi:glycosyltransferase involved in cell wall biosynthesis
MSNKHVPLDIGLPVYNGSAFLREALDSILSQTFGDFRLIISDNASQDATEEICRDYAAKDARIQYHRCPENLGAAPNFNRVFALSNSDLFKWIAADDRYQPTYLQECIARLDDRSFVLAHSQTAVIDSRGQSIEKDSSGTDLLDPPRRLDSAIPSVRFAEIVLRTHWCFEIFGVMRSEAVARSSRHMSFYGSDKVMLAELALMGRFAQVPAPLFHRREHPAASTSMRTVEERERRMDTRRKSGFNFPRLRCLKGYAAALRFGKLSVSERAACYSTLLKYSLQLRKWRKVMLDEPWYLVSSQHHTTLKIADVHL